MRFKKRLLVTILVLVAFLVLIEVAARFLLKPNRINLEGEHQLLLGTTWHQIKDYAQFIPRDDDAGCWATAIAQIGHYHHLTPTGKVEYQTSGGYQVSINLNDYEFRRNQLVSHIDDDTPDVSREQVAKYIYFIAAVIYTDFGAHGYLQHQTFIERLEKHLECSVEFHEYNKETFSKDRNNIQLLVKREIDSYRPIMLYFDNKDDFGHATVIDGYAQMKNSFLVHLNMGWGGRHDGWYDLFHRIIGIRDDLQTRFLIMIKSRKNKVSHKDNKEK